MVFPLAVIVATGAAFTVMVDPAEVAEHPLAFVINTEYVPGVVAVIVEVVAPLLHKYVAPALAVKTTFPPWQKVVGPPAVIVAAGEAFTITGVATDVALHPEAFVTVTV